MTSSIPTGTISTGAISPLAIPTPAGGSRPGWPGIIEAYRDRVPVPEGAKIVSLGEGNTPLLPAPHLSELTGATVYLKVEGANPTGSFKDRGMTVAVTHALAGGLEAVICASTGNTSASASAYAARAGLTSAVLIPRGKIAQGKLAQAVAYGARVLQIDGNFDDCLELVRKTAAEYPIGLVNSVNPVRLIGQKTAAWEICDVLGRAPDVHCLPVGNAGNITAYWRGYSEYVADGLVEAAPRMFGFQASGAAPLVLGEPVANPETIATAIRVGSPASWAGAVTARDESGGLFDKLTDEQILAAYRLLAHREGVFVEPSSATSVAGLLLTAADGRLPEGSVVVCTVTGHGLKDPDTALLGLSEVEPVPVDATAVASALELR
ncbi:threonine synthase [Actinokineospora sp. PR83]|uniref:threonine synthase n=1 Tax=Actinokineospora sp. PR83 TaxID=2884908 RepID=UPI001F38E7AB|nr:threonine synthase [Actinokineospora sp. PR83]MCG8915496.1 threonine synthase [Actinokineospora sp. PR83]